MRQAVEMPLGQALIGNPIHACPYTAWPSPASLSSPLYNLHNNGFQSYDVCPAHPGPSLPRPLPKGGDKPSSESHPHAALGPQTGEHSALEKLSVDVRLHSAPHVWFAVIRPAEQPALKVPFNEKRPTRLPWCSGTSGRTSGRI